VPKPLLIIGAKIEARKRRAEAGPRQLLREVGRQLLLEPLGKLKFRCLLKEQYLEFAR
jgi:hypothetical protein